MGVKIIGALQRNIEKIVGVKISRNFIIFLLASIILTIIYKFGYSLGKLFAHRIM